MVTNGFLMFWGGIVGLVTSFIVAVFLVISTRKTPKAISMKVAEKEMIQTDKKEKKATTRIDSIKLNSDSELKNTEVLSDYTGKVLPDTQLIKTK
ncbi:hypothetical protein [Lutispora sp.]|uniref:hypothetical protein n=1 Tax=Lutispora sp. TaxID=2828727 RepID=UPI0035646E24